MFGYCSLLHTLTDMNVSLFGSFEQSLKLSPYQRDFAITGSFAVCFS